MTIGSLGLLALGIDSENYEPLFWFMLITRVSLLIIFTASGIILLASLKQYSLRIYRISKNKILLTLIFGSFGLVLHSLNYLELVVEGSNQELTLKIFKDDSLGQNGIAYSLTLFAYIMLIEFLPLMSLQISLLISYRNNMQNNNKEIAALEEGDDLEEENEYLGYEDH
jgi:hypothetical protein